MGKRKTPINWKVYNDQLVQRGQNLMLSIRQMSRGIEDVWLNEVGSMNEHKRGRKFTYPDSLIVFLLVIKIQFGLAYRMLEGMGPMFSEKIPDYSRINRRINKLPKELIVKLNRELVRSKTAKTIEIIADATGIQINGKCVWSDERFGTKSRRKWKKLHLVIDAKTNVIVGVNVLDGRDNEGKHEEVVDIIGKVIGETGKTVTKFYGDGSYGSINNFEFFDYLGIDTAIRIRKDSVDKARRKYPLLKTRRDYEAVRQVNWEKFVREADYGKRSGIEGVIGSFKRIFGEHLVSKAETMLEKEVLAKVLLWNMMR